MAAVTDQEREIDIWLHEGDQKTFFGLFRQGGPYLERVGRVALIGIGFRVARGFPLKLCRPLMDSVLTLSDAEHPLFEGPVHILLAPNRYPFFAEALGSPFKEVPKVVCKLPFRATLRGPVEVLEHAKACSLVLDVHVPMAYDVTSASYVCVLCGHPYHEEGPCGVEGFVGLAGPRRPCSCVG